MPLIVARRFSDIEPQKVLAFQILFNGLEDWRQILLRRHQRRLRIANQKILSTGLLRELAKTFRRAAHRESSIARLEERQVDHVKRDTFLLSAIDDTVSTRSAAIIETVADEHDDAAFCAHTRQIVKRSQRARRGVEDRRPLISRGSKPERLARAVEIFCKRSRE